MASTLPDFSCHHFLVIGDVMLDAYLFGEVHRISPEAPVPVMAETRREFRPGGAANVAMNLAGLGAKVTLMGLVGPDGSAETLHQILTEQEIKTVFFPLLSVTTEKMRMVAKGQQMMRLDREDFFLGDLPQDFYNVLQQEMAPTHSILVSDYHKGFITESLMACLAKQKQPGQVIWVDPKKENVEMYLGADWVTPNFEEFKRMSGTSVVNEDASLEAAFAQCTWPIPNILVTRSSRGMSAATTQGFFHASSTAKEVYDVSGAGDTVMAVMAACLASGLTVPQAMSWANKAAEVVIAKQGTVPVQRTWLE
jgi:rfaE bifunctional protein kinase chain/domain